MTPATTEIRAPRRERPRYWPHRKFPTYRFRPGRNPHPRRDPSGHSYGLGERFPPQPDWKPGQWRELPAWLWGVDLFNDAYFWEAHEAWEELWTECARPSPPATFLQGLIQLAAALLKIDLESSTGARKLSSNGISKLKQVEELAPAYMGLDVSTTITEMEEYFRPLSRGVLPVMDDRPTLRLGMTVPSASEPE